MTPKLAIPCPYCAAQGIQMDAHIQRMKAIKEENTRYGCGNEHYFAVPTKEVLSKRKEAA